MAADKNPDDLYEEYKTARNERRRKAAERRNKKPNAQWDLPMVDVEQEEDATGPFKASVPYEKPDWYQAPTQAAPSAAAEVAAPVIRASAPHTDGENQWTNKHVRENHEYWVNNQWTRHIRDVHRASPLVYQEHEAEIRRVAAKDRERENARAAYGYHYRGEQQPSAQEPFQYPFHHGQIQHTVTAHQTEYDQRYGNSLVTQAGRSMPIVFLKHKNPRSHYGRAAGINDFRGHRNPSGYEPAAQAAYTGIWQ